MGKKPWIRIDDDSVVVSFYELQDLQDAAQIMKGNNLLNCKVYLNKGSLEHGDELAFVDNISFLEEIDKTGLNFNFYYSSNRNQPFALKKVIEYEKRLDKMCEKIKESNLSPLEKFVAVYEIVHFFKPYKEEDKEMSSTLSRNLYEYLDNNYMVCAGYADLLENLCKRVGIPCAYFGLDYLGEKREGHARNYVHIDDTKYNLNGFYVSDATQRKQIRMVGNFPIIADYETILMTTKEQQEQRKYNPNGGFRFFNYTKEEFLKLLEREGGNYIRILIQGDIKKIDASFGETLNNMDFYNSTDVENAWNYINSKINKPISNEILLSALMEAKKVLYPNISESTLSDLRVFYSREMGVEQENINTSKMSLKEIKSRYPIYYDSRIFYVINTELKNNSCDNLSIAWKKETERLRAFGFATSRIRANQDKIINQGYQINFNDRGQIDIQFPLLSNSEDIPLEEYITLLNKQIQDFSTMISSLSIQDNNASMREEDKEIQQNIHTEKEKANTKISLWKKIKALFSNKKKEDLKPIEVAKTEISKTNDTVPVESINTQQQVAANSYLGNSMDKTKEMHDTGVTPVNIDEMSKDQLAALKKQLEEEYSVEKPHGFSR